MGARTIKHGDHEHAVRAAKAEIFGMSIDDYGTSSIIESFGGDEKLLMVVAEKLVKYMNFLKAQEELDEALPRHTRVSSLVAFLQSPSFKMIGFTPRDNKDFFLLGFIWGQTTVRADDELPEGIKEELIKAFKRKVRGDDE